MINVNIVGGGSKLLNAFKKDNVGKKLITFCDLCWGRGESYIKLGFTLIKQNEPSYYYFGKITKWIRAHRSNFMKHILLKIIPNADETKTESELATIAGLYKIFDCGNLKFELLI